MEIQLSPVAELRKRNSRIQRFASALFVVSLGFWFVNIAVTFGMIDSVSPLFWVGKDLSTVSTFVFVLLFWCLTRQCGRNVRETKIFPEEVQKKGLPDSAFPAGFTFFLVMLGLAGTLWGLYIGLFSNDIKATADSGETQAVSQMIEQLLNGAATALLSSLWALVAAFLAANPLKACYEWACFFEGTDESDTLDSTVRKLADDLKSLSAASRIAKDNLESTAENRANGAESFFSAGLPNALHEQSLRTNELLEELVGLLSQNVEHSVRKREAADEVLEVDVDTPRSK